MALRQKQRLRAAVSVATKWGGLPQSSELKGPSSLPKKSKEEKQPQKAAQQVKRKFNANDRERKIKGLGNLFAWYAPSIGSGGDATLD